MRRALNRNTSSSSQYPQGKSPLASTSERDKPSLSEKGPDLSQFKFKKKPHIIIEFEDPSPTKEVKHEKEIKGIWEPPNWRDFLLNLQIMRSNNDAPVDLMGCHKSMDENALPQVYRYQCLVSLMLSSQTKDQVTFAAMGRLRTRGLTIDNILQISDEELGQLIYPVGFWKTKVKYIKKTTQTLKEQYNSDIPDSVDKLCKLTGVGPKMAHICMKVAWNKTTGIGVDTHVHRISNRIGWVRSPTNTPEDTRKALENWIPYDLWGEVNHLMVGFGQTICLPISPICNECLNSDICPSSNKNRKSPKKSPKKDYNASLKVKTEVKKSPSPTKKVKLNRESNTNVEITDSSPDNKVILETLNDIIKENHSPESSTFISSHKGSSELNKESKLAVCRTNTHKKIAPKKELQSIKTIVEEVDNVNTESIQVEFQQRITRGRKENKFEGGACSKEIKPSVKRKSPRNKPS